MDQSEASIKIIDQSEASIKRIGQSGESSVKHLEDNPVTRLGSLCDHLLCQGTLTLTQGQGLQIIRYHHRLGELLNLGERVRAGAEDEDERLGGRGVAITNQ